MEPENKYRLTDRFLKNGEFSSEVNVIKCYDTASGEDAAVKRWKKDDYRGINEISQRSKLSFESIAPFICSFEEENFRYMVCKWAEGENLEDYITENGTLEECEALEIFKTLCEFLVYIGEHETGPLIYGDLKPGNIIVKRRKENDGRKFDVKIIDFETCMKSDLSGREKYGFFETLPFGSYFFSAPEALNGKSTVYSDVYSVGAVLGYMLFGGEFYENTEKCIQNGKFGSISIIKECMIREEPFKRIPPKRLIQKLVRYLETGTYEEEKEPEQENEETKEETAEKVCADFDGTEEIDYGTEKEKIAAGTDKKHKRSSENLCFAGKLSICTDDNLCFATELAYTCAEDFGMRTILVDSFVDKNRISTFMLADMVRENDINRYGYGTLGFETCLYTDRDKWYENGLIGKTEKSENLFTGTKLLQEEIFSDEGKLEDFYTWAYKHFDAVILNMYKNTDQSVRDRIMKVFEYVVVAPESNIDEMESACEHYSNLTRQGKVYRKNVKYVAWDYRKDQSLPEKGIRYITGDDRYLGAISFDDDRYRKRNTGERPEFYGSNAEVKNEYNAILNKMLFGGKK